MRFGVAPIAAASQATASDGRRVRALNAGPPGVLGGERGGFLPGPRALARLVEDLGPDRELARRILGRGARLADRTGAAGRGMEPDAHHGIARDIPAWRPSDAGLPLGTAGLLPLPIDHEGAQIVAVARPPLVALRPKGRADHGDLRLGVGGDKECGIHIAAIEQRRAREEITIGQVWLDGRSHDAIRRGRWGRCHRRHDRRLALVAGFREMDLGADPGDPAF
jgi:hypothetical protein